MAFKQLLEQNCSLSSKQPLRSALAILSSLRMDLLISTEKNFVPSNFAPFEIHTPFKVDSYQSCTGKVCIDKAALLDINAHPKRAGEISCAKIILPPILHEKYRI